MGFTTFTALNSVIIVGLICLAYLTETQAQIQNPVITTEGTDVQLTIIIPDNDLASNSRVISIRQDSGLSQNQTNILYLLKNDPKVTDAFLSRLVATYTNTSRTLRMQLKNVAAADAGTFRCYSGGGALGVADCGQLLIIIRKPGTPAVKVSPSSSIVVGSVLQLLCETHSNSLPPNHGLTSEIWWYDHKGQSVGDSGNNPRIYVNPQTYELVIANLDRTDKGLKFYCASADNSGDVTKRIISDNSSFFEVIPEYAPTQPDLSPPFKDNEVVRKGVGEKISVTCGADCWPQCNISWSYRKLTGPGRFSNISVLMDKSILDLEVARTNEGSYKCKAENNHDSAKKVFILEASYIGAPVISINGAERNSATLPEKTQVNLTCVFDSNPGLTVRWVSPNQTTLFTETAVSLPENTDGGEMYKRLYASSFLPTHLSCEDFGLYKCEGNNGINTKEEQIDLEFTCAPSSANIPGLQLKGDYAWEVTKPLNFQFVIRAFPEPDITQIVSSINGIVINEEKPKHVTITKTSKYDGKQYLTKFNFTSLRNLDKHDTDRVYTMTVKSAEMEQNFTFRIHPRGPPDEVINLTAVEVRHDSLSLFWLPGFDGGEIQTFSVQHCVRDLLGNEGAEQQNACTLVQENITDPPLGDWVEVKLTSLRSSTDYIIKVSAFNALGSSMYEIEVKTSAAPDDSLSGGAIAGIFIAVIIILLIIALVLYFFVYRRRYGADRHNRRNAGEARRPMIPQALTAFFKQDRSQQRSTAGVRTNGSASRKLPWAKLGNIFKRNSSDEKSDFIYIPPKDYAVDDDENAVYMNTGADRNPESSPVNPPFTDLDSETNTPESSRKLNDQGLVYVEVEFPINNKKKNNNNKKKKGKEMKSKKIHQDENKNENRVDYSDIDFTQTAAKRKEWEESKKMLEAKNNEDVESGDDDSVPQSECKEEDKKQKNKYADAGFGIGTTV